MIKNVVRIGLGVLTTLFAIITLWQFRTAVLMVLVSLILTVSTKPFFTKMNRQQKNNRWVWILIYVFVILALVTLFIFALQSSISELQNLSEGVSFEVRWKFLLWRNSIGLQSFFNQLPTPSILFQALIGNDDNGLFIPNMFGIAQNIGHIITVTIIILVLSIYLSIHQVHFERLWLSLLPPNSRKKVRDIWRLTASAIGSYVRGILLYSILLGITLGLGYWLIGSSYPISLILIGTIGSMIPVVGWFLVIFLPMLLDLLTNAQINTFLVLYTILIMSTFGFWIKPKLVNRQWNNSILSLVIMIALADAIGIIGIVIAPLFSIIIQILWKRVIIHSEKTDSVNFLSSLQERVNHLKVTVSKMDEPKLSIITNSISRITYLINEAEPILKDKPIFEE